MAIKTIIVSGRPVILEDLANEAISPGHLVEMVPDQASPARNIRKHGSDDGTDISSMFALENEVVGDDINESYASGELVRYAVFRPGDRALARLKASIAIQPGDKLGSNGDGTLDLSTTVGAVICAADQHLASTGSVQLVKVQII